MICNSYFHTEKITLSLLHITSLVHCNISLLRIVINNYNHPILVFFTFSDDDHSILGFFTFSDDDHLETYNINRTAPSRLLQRLDWRGERSSEEQGSSTGN